MSAINKTCMSYWFPLLESAGLPVPATKSVEMPIELCRNILMVFYGEKPDNDPRLHPFFAELANAIASIGTPCFLRTGQTSNKHAWEKSCFVADGDSLVEHVYEIAEFSEIADFCGLPFNLWFVRELLPSVKFGACPRYDNMPVAREFRFFVEDGAIVCFHPYWPLESLRDGGWNGTTHDFERLCDAGEDEADLRNLAMRVSSAIPGAWSVDLLQTERGWFVTDMAEASRSYHWEGCSQEKKQ